MVNEEDQRKYSDFGQDLQDMDFDIKNSDK